MNCKEILKLSAAEAREFFLRNDSYLGGLKLPDYFWFEELLKKLNEHDFNTSCGGYEEICKAKEFKNINFDIDIGKSGFEWRRLQLINPIIYVALVQLLTTKKNWGELMNKFKQFAKNKKIQCKSIPVVTQKPKKAARERILRWWMEVEQSSIEQILDYSYVFEADIAKCYDSIYTHSIPWAIHGKEHAKNNKKEGNLGNTIDRYIQAMSFGQTNGIPQGSVLMDFIAEIVLGYVDTELSEKIKGIKDYHIIRYVDGYRIFVNNPQDGEKIMKALTEVLGGVKMSLNAGKTRKSEDLISASVKPDKWYVTLHPEIGMRFNNQNQKWILRIYEYSKQFPDSGQLYWVLNNYCEKLQKRLKSKKLEGIKTEISIISEIMYNNPKMYPMTVTIISQLLNKLDENEQEEILSKIIKKFKRKPKTVHLDIWLQRLVLSAGFDNNDLNSNICKFTRKQFYAYAEKYIKSEESEKNPEFRDKLLKFIEPHQTTNTEIDASPLWNIEWAHVKLQSIVGEPLSVFNFNEETLGYPISPEEGNKPFPGSF